jgi:two-component system sensor histidine kinase KdpD
MTDERSFRVRIEAGGTTLGSIWATRQRDTGEPDRTATRLLAAAADQVGQALAQDRLAADARMAEIATQSDALKSALLESVSHDLRTPLASIRASAGTLMDPDVVVSWDDVRTSAASIDREAERLNALVANLLDLGRIEGGALRAARDALDLEDLVLRAVGLVEARLGGRLVTVEVRGAPVVLGDPVLLEESLLNVLDNAIRHTPPETRIRISSHERPEDGLVRLTIEDSGPGVPDSALERLFEKFYRLPRAGAGSRGGTGIGLAVVRGLIEAMAGRVTARPSQLGGVAIDIELPLAPLPSGALMEPS